MMYGEGAYGSFFSWCLEYFTDKKGNIGRNPFTKDGSAHNYESYFVNSKEVWETLPELGDPVPGREFYSHMISDETYLSSEEIQARVIRAHLWVNSSQTSQNLDVKKDRNWFEKISDKRILLLPSEDMLLLLLNNIHSKITSQFGSENMPLPEDLERWGFSRWEDTPRWIRREWLSLSARKSLGDACGLNYRDEFGEFCYIIELNDLFSNFEGTLRSAIEYIGRDITNEEDIKAVFEQWKSLQVHYRSDDRIRDISDAIIGSQEMEWNELTLAEEAWLQMLLRDAGYELKCDGLDIFPRKSKELREIMYVA